MIFLNNFFLGVFHYFSHHSHATIFIALLLLSIQYQVCVLGAINESYEALCDVHMYVCMCLKVSVNYSQPAKVLFYFHMTHWVNILFLWILNLEGQQNCIIGSKVTIILQMFFFN